MATDARVMDAGMDTAAGDIEDFMAVIACICAVM